MNFLIWYFLTICELADSHVQVKGFSSEEYLELASTSSLFPIEVKPYSAYDISSRVVSFGQELFLFRNKRSRKGHNICRNPCQIRLNWVSRSQVVRDLGLSPKVYTVKRLDEKWNERKVSINMGLCYGSCRHKTNFSKVSQKKL